MENNDTTLEVIPRKAERGAKQREHDRLLEDIRAHTDVPNDYHPVVALAVAANNPRLPVSLQVKANAEVALYLCRKLKPIDAPGDNDGAVPEAIVTMHALPPGIPPNVVIDD